MLILINTVSVFSMFAAIYPTLMMKLCLMDQDHETWKLRSYLYKLLYFEGWYIYIYIHIHIYIRILLLFKLIVVIAVSTWSDFDKTVLFSKRILLLSKLILVIVLYIISAFAKIYAPSTPILLPFRLIVIIIVFTYCMRWK